MATKRAMKQAVEAVNKKGEDFLTGDCRNSETSAKASRRDGRRMEDMPPS